MAIVYTDNQVTPKTTGSIKYMTTPEEKKSFWDNVAGTAKAVLPTAINAAKATIGVPTGETAQKIGATPQGEQFGIGAINQAGFGLPVPIARKAGMNIPEPQSKSEEAARMAGNVVGFASGGPMKLATKAVSAIPALAGKAILPTMGRLGLESAIGGASTTEAPTLEKTPDLAGRGERLLTYGATGVALPALSRLTKTVIAGGTRWVAKNFGGITDATVNIINKLGAKRVFDPEKAQADYVGSTIVPKVKERIATAIDKYVPGTNNLLVKLGVPKEEVDLMGSISPSGRRILANVVKGTEQNPLQAVEGMKNAVQDYFKKTLDKIPDDIINIDLKNTANGLKKELQNMGWTAETGEALKSGTGVSNTTRDNLQKVYDYINSLVKNKVPVTKQIYYGIKNDLETVLTGNNKFDRIVYATQTRMNNDFENSIMKERDLIKKILPNANPIFGSIKEANKKYSEMMKLTQITKAFEKLGDERQPLSVMIESKINSLGDPKKFNQRQMWRNIMGQNLFDDFEAHLANRDFEMVSSVPGAGGGMYPSKAGVIKTGIANVSKGYYKNVKPAVKSAMETGKSVVSKLPAISANLGYQIGQTVTAPDGRKAVVTGYDRDGHPQVQPQ